MYAQRCQETRLSVHTAPSLDAGRERDCGNLQNANQEKHPDSNSVDLRQASTSLFDRRVPI